MIRPALQRRTSAWWAGRRVVATRELRTGEAIYPRGLELVVERKFGGLELRREPCSCCGVSVRIGRVPFSDLELIE